MWARTCESTLLVGLLALALACFVAAPTLQAQNLVTITVELRDSKGNLIENSGATIVYQPYSSGSYIKFGDGVLDPDGRETAQIPAGRHRFRLTYQNCTQEKQLTVGEGSVVVYQTRLVTVELRDSSGNLIPNSGATIVWQPGSGGSYVPFGDGVLNADGTESMEVLPLKHRFRMTYLGKTVEKQQNVGLNPIVLFQLSEFTDDTEPPTIICPGDVVVETDPGRCYATNVDLGTPAVRDNCGVASVTNDAPTQFPKGETIVIWTVTDTSGNTSTCTQKVTVVDNEPPQITCPGNITVDVDPGACGASVSFAATATDNCGTSTIKYYLGSTEITSPYMFPVGTTTVKAVTTDSAGNSSECAFTVTVVDNEPPTITCPIPASEYFTDAGKCCASLSFAAEATDNCGVAKIEYFVGGTKISFPYAFPVGITTVQVVATDIHGNTAGCSFDVKVVDKEPPMISCPGDITVNTDPGKCGAVVIYSVTSSDNCPGAVLEQLSGLPSGSLFPVGTTTNTFKVTDASGNSATCSFAVTVVDAEPPVLTCPANKTVNTDPGQCYATLDLGMATATDNCSGVTVVGIRSDGKSLDEPYSKGVTTITWTARDAAGNEASCVQTVTVTDTERPVITLNGEAVITLECGVDWYTEPGATVSDNCCPGSLVITGIVDTTKTGTYYIRYKTTDCSGNAAEELIRTVYVVDTQPPIIQDCPGNIVVSNDPGKCGAVVSWVEPSARDACCLASFTSTHKPGDFFPVGTTTVAYTAVDCHGNKSICSFTVTVRDEEPPANPSLSSTSHSVGVWTNNPDVVILVGTASDNCGVDGFEYAWDQNLSWTPARQKMVEENWVGDKFVATASGQWYFHLATVDRAGNWSEPVHLGPFAIDLEKPGIPENLSPADGTVTNDPSPRLSWSAPADFGGSGIKNYRYQVDDNPDFSSPIKDGYTNNTYYTPNLSEGTYWWRIRARDNAGNNGDWTEARRIIIDTTPPEIICPQPIVQANDFGSCGAVVNWPEPVVNDNVGIASVSCSPSSGSLFPVGTTMVTCRVVDLAGNATQCPFAVTVKDKEKPTIEGCPEDFLVSNDPGKCGAVVRWTELSARDNCGLFSLVGSHKPGDFFPVGTTTITYTARDIHGNSTTCAFKVTVEDKEPPTITCPIPASEYPTDAGKCFASLSFAAEATDNCGVAKIEYFVGGTKISFPYAFPVGTTTVQVVATDIHGNTAGCSFDVKVVDKEPPTSRCPEDVVVGTDPGCCYATNVDLGTPTVSDNSGVQSLTNNAPTQFPKGETLVTWTVTDTSGNIATCTQKVTVVDNEPPTLSCPGDIRVDNDLGKCGAVVTYSVTYSDNCPGVVLEQLSGLPSDSLFPVGTTTNTFKVTDASGNSATCSFTVTVVDNEPPTITCPIPASEYFTDAGKCFASLSFAAEATDNCGVAKIEYFVGGTKISFPYAFPVGTTTVQVVATDIHGNSSSCSFTVKVKDTAPAISIRKEADRASARVGETITYTISVTNTGDTYLHNVFVSDPSLGTLVGPLGDDGDGILKPNEAWTYTGTYTVATAEVGGTISNIASATATDPCGKVVQATSNNVVVSWTNSPPRALRQTVRTCKNIPITFSLVGTDPDVDPNHPGLHPLTFDILGGPANGILSGNLAAVTYSVPHQAAVSVTYTPALDFLGTDTITFEVWDPMGFFAIGTVTITVESCGEEVPAGGAAAYAPVVINEIAWAGTPASPEDQWIELLNVTDQPIDLTGWVLRWRRKFPTTPEEAEWKVVELRGVIPAQGYFLLERGHDNVVSDIPADLIYDTTPPYNLKFSPFGDIVELLDASGNVVDTANADRPERDGWIAGSAAPFFATMERIDPHDRDHEGNWATNRGIIVNGLDAKKSLLIATARSVNEEALIRVLAAQPVVTASLGETLTVTLELPTWAQQIAELPKLTVARGDVAGGAGAVVPPEELGEAVQGRRLAGLLNYEVTVDTTKLGEGVFQIWITIGKGVVHLLTVEIRPAS
jgi:hypothetical protein